MSLRDLQFTCNYVYSPKFGPIKKKGDGYYVETTKAPVLVGPDANTMNYAGELAAGGKTTSPCHNTLLEAMLKDPQFSVQPNRMEVTVWFRPYFLRFRSSKSFRFKADYDVDRRVRWLPE